MVEFNKFEEYKLFVEDTARFTERRQTVSNIYIAVNSLLLTAVGLLIKELGALCYWTLLLPLPFIASGIGVSLWWGQIIRKYKAIVGLRIDTLRDMEDDMEGSVRMYHAEDKLYPRDQNGNMIHGKGLNFSDHEARLPGLFMVLYCIFIIGLITAFVIKVLCLK